MLPELLAEFLAETVVRMVTMCIPVPVPPVGPWKAVPFPSPKGAVDS